MLAATYRDLFVAIATSAGALTGLLFVALSVTPRREYTTGSYLIRQIRAAAALLAFLNALAVSLYGLVPTSNIGYPALVIGIIGILFVAAAIRSVVASGSTRRQQLGQVGLFVLLLAIFGIEIVSGLAIIGHPNNSAQLQTIGYALVSSLIVGIARAWELVGERDTGLLASLAVLIGRPLPVGTISAGPSEAQAGQADQGQPDESPGEMRDRGESGGH
jgi:hypothetical protein